MTKEKTSAKKRTPEGDNREWHLIDADGQYVGRLATRIATLLMGKNRPDFTPHIDMGAFVIVLNTDKLKISGAKADQKEYFHFSGYPGGLSSTLYKDLFKKDSGEVLRRAIWGMMAKNRLRDLKIKRLKLFKAEKHPYQDKFKK